MIAHYHGQVWNSAEFARSIGSSEGTARRYLDILAGAYMVRILPPWFENLSKRIALADLGLEHLWIVYPGTEGFALDERLSALPLRDVGRLPGRMNAGQSWRPT